MKSFDDELSVLNRRLDDAKLILGYDALSARKSELEKLVSDANLWDDPDHARKVTADYSSVSDDLGLISSLVRDLEDAETRPRSSLTDEYSAVTFLAWSGSSQRFASLTSFSNSLFLADSAS